MQSRQLPQNREALRNAVQHAAESLEDISNAAVRSAGFASLAAVQLKADDSADDLVKRALATAAAMPSPEDRALALLHVARLISSAGAEEGASQEARRAESNSD
jgi:hypothetical protein